MKHNRVPFFYLLSQFQTTSKKLNQALDKGKFQHLPVQEQCHLRDQLHRMYSRLRSAFSARRLRRILAGAAVLLGISASTPVQAQFNFGSPTPNPWNIGGYGFVNYDKPTFTDLNGDGLLDIMVGDRNGDFTYFENIGTATVPNFGNGATNPFGLTRLTGLPGFINSAPAMGDLDGDGDLDLMAGAEDGYFAYFENTGSTTVPAFAPVAIDTFGLSTFQTVLYPTLGDLDNDGDLDLVSGHYYGNMEYFENTGTASAPAFAAPVNNFFGINVGSIQNSHPTLVDIDGDMDLDILQGDYSGGWYFYENTGTASSPSFGSPNPAGGSIPYIGYFNTPTVGDLDGDGDLDLLAGTYNEMYYFENTISTTIGEELLPEVQILNDPAQGTAWLKFTLPTPSEAIHWSLIDLQGRTLIKQPHSSANSIFDLTAFPAGVYILEVKLNQQILRQRVARW